jgi:Tfp pilus assembly protein PilP
MTMGPLGSILAAALLTLAAQQTATPAMQKSGTPNSPPATDAPPPAPPIPAPGEGYKYNPEGRRDPFLSLVGASPGDQRGAQARRPDGIAGMFVSEISLRGVMQSRGALIGMVTGPDNKTHLVHAGDKFFDGSVQAVEPDALVILQEVNDPLSLVKQRIVRKPLRSLEVVKQ